MVSSKTITFANTCFGTDAIYLILVDYVFELYLLLTFFNGRTFCNRFHIMPKFPCGSRCLIRCRL